MPWHLTRRRFAIALPAFALAASGARAQAPAWPQRPVKIIVPVAAGTATDLTARIFGERLSLLWKQPVVVEARPGADGLIAINAFVQGRDDHTLLFSFSTAVSLNPLIHQNLSYDPAADLVPVATTTEVLFAVAVHAALPARSFSEFAGHAKANPGKLNWAAAPGLPRFVFERVAREAGLDLAYISYAQTGAAVQDLGEGRIQAMIGAVNTLLPVIESGKARALAIAANARAAILPDAPSAIEAGFPNLAVPAVGCVYGWKGMPPDLRARLASEIDLIAADSEIAARFQKIGQIVRRSNPDALDKLLAEQRIALAPIARAMAGGK